MINIKERVNLLKKFINSCRIKTHEVKNLINTKERVNKENRILKISILVSIIGSIIFLSVLKYTYPNLSYSEWNSILSNFVAGAFGGIITLTTVYITLIGNKSQEYYKIKKDMQLKVCEDIIRKINESVTSIQKSFKENRGKKLLQLISEEIFIHDLNDDVSKTIKELINVYIANDLLLVDIYSEFKEFKNHMDGHNTCLKSIKENYKRDKYDKELNSNLIYLYECCLENMIEYLELFREEIYRQFYSDILKDEIYKYSEVLEERRLVKYERLVDMLSQVDTPDRIDETLEEKYKRIKESVDNLGTTA
ncbi:hypothetical protein [Clostridium oceanicum]|uniref:Phage abortive infection protein n=1 Tax=Clostridium oceanicum TaxID=1543 RepID=A0ABN1JC52_9CLOT